MRSHAWERMELHGVSKCNVCHRHDQNFDEKFEMCDEKIEKKDGRPDRYKKCERKKITRGERARERTRAEKTAEKDERVRRSRNVRMAIIGMLCHLLRNSTTSDEDC